MNLLDGFRFMFSKKPYYIVLHPTARCNCKCSFCFNWKGVKNSKKDDELTLEEIKKLSKSISHVKYLTISGGEPFLRNDIAEICNTFYNGNRTRSIALHTNCSFPERVENAVKEVLKSCPGLYFIVCPSIDGLYEEHDKLRGYKGLFSKVEKTIKSLKRIQQNYNRLCILPVGLFFKAAEDKALELSNFFMQYGLLHSKVIPRGDVNQGVIPTPTSYSKYVQKQRLFTGWYGNRENLNLAYENFKNILDTLRPRFIMRILKNRKRVLKCSAGVKTVTIRPNGSVAACEPFLNKKKFFMGKLRDFDYDIGRLLNSDRAQRVKSYIKSSGCTCTWECIMPINMLFDRRQAFLILKGYLSNLANVVCCFARFISEEVQRQFYLFYGRNTLLNFAKAASNILKFSAKSAIRGFRFKSKDKCEVLFINPPPRIEWTNSNFKPHNEEPLGIMSLASFLKGKGFRVRIIDMPAEEMKTKDVINEISYAQPAIVGVSAITRQANIAYDIGMEIKKYYPKIHLVYGGVHSTFFPKEPFEKGCADFVVIGEGEKTMEDLCKSILRKAKSLSYINGLAYKEEGTIKVNRPRQFIKNLGIIPSPAYDMLRGKYHTTIHIPPLNKERAFSIMASRGCPYNCKYCSIPAMWKRTLRHRSPQRVVAEIKDSINQYRVKNFHFYDDDFLINKRFVHKFCNILIKEGLKATWLCQSRASSIVCHRDLVPILKKAGCEVIELGIESCDESVMQSMNKMQKLNDVKEAVRIIRKGGIDVIPLMMAFYPGETLNSVYNTSSLMINLGLWSNNHIEIYTRKNSPTECNGAPFIHGFFTTAIPGSELYDSAKKEGLIFAKDWEDYKFSRVNFVPKSFLDDTPVKVSVMDKKEFFQNMLKYRNTIIYHILRRDSVIGSFKDTQDYFKFLYSVYCKCDGKLAVWKLCRNLSDCYNIPQACIALRFLAMFEFIRSRKQ